MHHEVFNWISVTIWNLYSRNCGEKITSQTAAQQDQIKALLSESGDPWWLRILIDFY